MGFDLPLGEPASPFGGSGFSFGSQKPAGATGGFSFGGAGASSSATPTVPPSGFSFGSTTNAGNTNADNSKTASSPFSFASKQAAGTSTPAPKPAFSFAGIGGPPSGSTTPAASPAPFAAFGAANYSNSSGIGTSNTAQSQPSTAPSAPSGFSFGSSAASKSASSTPNPFGGLGGLGSANTNANTTTPASKPPPTTFAFAPTTGGLTSGFSFGAPKPSTENKEVPKDDAAAGKNAATPASAPSNPFSGFKLGGGADTGTSAPAAPTPSSAPAASGTGGFSFGSKAPETPFVNGKISSPATNPAPQGFSFGKPTNAATAPAPAAAETAASANPSALHPSIASTTAAPANPPKPTFSFGAASSSATSGTGAAPLASSSNATSNSLSLGPASQSKISVPVPSLLKGMTLEDIINRWSSDLDERVREFTNLASEIKAWDSVLISNGDEISRLCNSLQALDPVSTTISESLDYVENEQKHMGSVLDEYESQLDEILVGRNGQNGLGKGLTGGLVRQPANANFEREKTYQLAESLNNQLDDLSRSLTSLINEVNSLSSSSGLVPSDFSSSAGQQDPVSAIAAILNAHLSSLSWIEKTGDMLAGQVEELEAKMKVASGEKWQGLSNSRIRSAQRGGTPSRTPQRSPYSVSSTRPPGNGTPARNGFGQSNPGGRAGTPSRLGQSSLGRSAAFGSSSRW
ncbi:MAG: FG-nucleoporin nsp1 [Cyphobasidiales sp. Tagirdzhanova-0007]|nr:MAG: FG-nucleoporin nsp1 [Cyphobasidiales sp. Tagirdzhanova-0007]